MSRAVGASTLRRVVLFLSAVGLPALLAPGCADLHLRGEGQAPEEPRHEQQKERTIRGVGSAPAPEEGQGTPDELLTTARRNLAANIQSRVTGLIRDYVAQSAGASSDKGRWREFGEVLASETAAQVLQDLGEYSTWKNPPGNTLFVQYEVKAQQVRSRAAGLVPELVETVNPFGQDRQKGITALTAFLEEGPRPEEPARRPVEPGSETDEHDEGAETEVPAWLSKGPYEVHAFEDYTAEVAVGDDREQAEEAARRAVVESLTVGMRSEASRLSRSAERQELAAHVERLPRRMISYRPETYTAPRVTHSWYDSQSGAYYALAALERAAAREQAGSAALSAAEAGRKVLKDARRQRDNNSVRAALESYVKAVGHMRAAARSALAALAVDRSELGEGQIEELTQNLALENAHAELSRLLGKLSAEAKEGNLQWVSPGARPSAPLAARLTAGADAPLADVPVEFRMEDDEGEWRETVRTGKGGTAQIRPPALEGQAGDEVRIVAALKPAALVGDMSHLDLPVPKAQFRCLLRSKEQTRFSLHVRERSLEDGPASDPIVADTLSEALKSSNFRLQRLSGLLDSGGLWSEDGELRRENILSAARATASVEGLGAAPVVIAATCRHGAWNTTETGQGTLYFVTAHVRLWVIDPAFSGDPAPAVDTIDVREQGAYTDDWAEAYRQARRKAAETVAQELAALLEKRFE